MAIEINTVADEIRFMQYRQLRDGPRHTLAEGIYPQILRCLGQYERLEQALQSDMEDMAVFHATATAAVDPYIDTIRTALITVRDTMQAIELAAPGTFNIDMPTPPDPIE